MEAYVILELNSRVLRIINWLLLELILLEVALEIVPTSSSTKKICVRRLLLLTFLSIRSSTSEEICVRMYWDSSRSWSRFSSRNDRRSQRWPSLLLLNRRLLDRSKHVIGILLLVITVILESYSAMARIIADEKVVWLLRWCRVAQRLLVSKETCIGDIRVIILRWCSEWI